MCNQSCGKPLTFHIIQTIIKVLLIFECFRIYGSLGRHKSHIYFHLFTCEFKTLFFIYISRRRNEIHSYKYSATGGVTVPTLMISLVIGLPKPAANSKPHATFCTPPTSHRQREERERGRDKRENHPERKNSRTEKVLSMPAYATNMRLKFPILALTLEVVTIVLYALLVVYDTGDDHGHGSHEESNTTHSSSPMTLYPSKYPPVRFVYVL